MNKNTIYKVPKGTQDFNPDKQYLRRAMISKAIEKFKLYGAKEIDTPTFEREDVLMEKYGEESSKEIFRLVNKEVDKEVNDTKDLSESLALRYDLTVPFSRYIKTTGLKKLKRYQIGKVYRKDQPNMKSGRFREFLQCDYDCLDARTDPNLADAETISLLIDILDDMIGNNESNNEEIKYTIRLNDRNILYGMLEYCNVPKYLYTTVCSSIDKLDKKKWKEISKELVTKGLNNTVIIKLKETLNKYKNITWEELGVLEFVTLNNNLITTYNFMKLLFPYKLNRIKLDLSLVRGLDYYTGVIFEVVLVNKSKKNSIGSIAGGGRYDNLCGVPCVGFSVGIDRIVVFLNKNKQSKRNYNPTVWVVQVNPELGDNINQKPNQQLNQLLNYRLSIVTKLREYGISAGTELKSDAGMSAQIKYVLKNEIPYIIFVGPEEMEKNCITVKDMDEEKQYENLSIKQFVSRWKQ